MMPTPTSTLSDDNPVAGGEVQAWYQELQAWHSRATVWHKAHYAWSILCQAWYWRALSWSKGQPGTVKHPPYIPAKWQLKPLPAPPEGLASKVAPEDPRRLASRGKGEGRR